MQSDTILLKSPVIGQDDDNVNIWTMTMGRCHQMLDATHTDTQTIQQSLTVQFLGVFHVSWCCHCEEEQLKDPAPINRSARQLVFSSATPWHYQISGKLVWKM